MLKTKTEIERELKQLASGLEMTAAYLQACRQKAQIVTADLYSFLQQLSARSTLHSHRKLIGWQIRLLKRRLEQVETLLASDRGIKQAGDLTGRVPSTTESVRDTMKP